MEIDKNNFFEIFRQNFNFEIVETCIGKTIKMDSYNAFLYCNITGAGYFDNPVFPFTPKGMMKLFYNAFDYKFVTGIFENTALNNTPYKLSLIKPYLFEGDKFIIPVEFISEIELQKELKQYRNELILQNIPTTDFIIQRIEKSKKGNGMEPFMEYLTCETFKNHGFVVENQIPLAHSIGSPDFGGYKTKEYIDFVSKYNCLPLGFHIIELAMLRLFKDRKYNMNAIDLTNDAIVGEAKTSTKMMTGQLLKYLNTSLFSAGYEIYPFKSYPNEEFFGLVTLDENLKIKLINPGKRYTEYANMLNKEEYYSWLNNYFKYYLIANLTNDELNEFYYSKVGDRIGTSDDIINFVNKCSFDEIYKIFA
jgi:hypothetical protein